MMTDLHAEALDYPADNREAALELLLQKQLLDVQLHGSETKLEVLRRRSRFAATRVNGFAVAIGVVALVCMFAGLIDGKTAGLIANGSLVVVLIVVFVVARARRQIERITRQQEAVTEINAALGGLRHEIEDHELWQATVRSSILRKLDNKVSPDTKRDYLMLILGGFILICMVSYLLNQ